MTQPRLLNPDGRLPGDIEQRLRRARKIRPLWAKRLVAAQDLATIEGNTAASAGDYLCRGVADEQWAQRADRLLARYLPSGVLDQAGFERFDPRPDAAVVEVAPVEVAFCVATRWGVLNGKAQDFVVRCTADPSDLWIVSRSIFQYSYQMIAE
jgi:hypothetical protein